MPDNPVTLKNCEDEQIHIPGSIQHYGYLIAFDPESFNITIVSANIAELYPFDTAENLNTESKCVGKSVFANIFSEKSRPAIVEALHLARETKIRLPVDLKLLKTELENVSAILYLSGEHAVIEIEPEDDSTVAKNASSFSVARFVKDLRAYENLSDLANHIAHSIKQLTNYDRVMVYRFDQNYNGEVIAEAREDSLEPFLNLRYPASDIPPQARRLYTVNLIRMIADVNGATFPLVGGGNHSSDEALDLTHSMLRSVSKIHIEYLNNMGVSATMSISLMQDNELWGLIACHNYSPKYVPQYLRLQCEQLAQIYSWQIITKQEQIAINERLDSEDLIRDIIQSFVENESSFKTLGPLQEKLLTFFKAIGFVLVLGDEVTEVGETPSEVLTRALASHCQKKTVTICSIDSIFNENDFKQNHLFGNISGALYMSLSSQHGYFAIWFREEKAKTVNWAGAPGVKTSNDENRLSPRGSFALWKETVNKHCEPWSSFDIYCAERFNKLFVDQVIDQKIKIQQSLNKLQEIDRTKDQFLATVSHELRAPLNVIVGWSDLGLLDENNAEQMVESLKIIRKNALTQSELINDLLDLSRIVAGTLKLSVKNVNLDHIVNDIRESFAMAAKVKNIEVHRVVTNDLQTILGDPVRIKQILWNLVSNAIKFTPKNGKVIISARRVDSTYILDVTDNGKGLRKEDMLKVFDRFTQVDSQHGKIGMGIGLSIVKHLVEMHGGSVEVSSLGPNKGSTFTVKFPVSPVEFNEGDTESQLTDSGTNVANTNMGTGRLSSLNILVVEDDDEARTFLTKLLMSQDATVSNAENGERALAVIESSEVLFDLVLSDIGMPQMDGYELIKALRNTSGEKYDNLCAIALTAFAYSTDRVKALKAGFNSYVTKPVDLEELITVIESTCL